ncbi:MAG: phosphotransferase family protein [Hydrogenophaga sp.]|nr:phosphotransferase family protein [Hydrogenophaga sp.]
MKTLTHKETAPTAAHGLDLRALTRCLAPHVDADLAGLQAERISGGQSNPTWRLSSGDRAWVLRAKPGPVAGLLPSAHAIEREFRVLQALRGSPVPVPRARVLCEDESVIGAAFYVMDWVDGRILRDARLPGLPLSERAAYHQEALRVLAVLHRVDWRGAGLQDFGRHSGFFGRLIHRWGQQYRASVVEPVAAMERLAQWLPGHIPSGADGEGNTCLTHGDFRLENLMFHPERARVVAVLDWELATLGHPLSDLAYHCLAWHLPCGVLRGFGDQDRAALGIPSEREHIESYCAQTGRSVDAVLADWPFYLACNLFRLGAILLGIAARVREGTAANPDALEIARMAVPVAELGWAMAQGQVLTHKA